MPLEITMRAGDFIYVGTSRITVHSAGGTVVSVDGDMPVVRRRDYVEIGEDPPPGRQLYVMLQTSYLAEDFEEEAPEAGGVEYRPCCEETELLEAFWEVARRYDHVVTFNGRGFDVPFLYLRSGVLNVPITRKDWLGYRYATEPHCDLAEQLTFYGVSGREGAARKFNLDFYCKAFGIESPKSHGVSGTDVNDMMQSGRYREIAQYCVRDVRATVELYQIWKSRFAGVK